MVMTRVVVVIWLAAMAAGALAEPARGQSPAADAAENSARRSLNGPIQFPWYDAQQDVLKRVDLAPPADLKNRSSAWEVSPAPNWSAPDWPWKLLEILGWGILIVAIVVLIVALARAFLSHEATLEAARSQVSGAPNQEIDRIENLPFLIKRPQADLLSEARRLYEAGEFGQAIIYLYSYQLVQLDKHQALRLAKGKTNRQYLRELRNRPWFAELLGRTMVAFEDVFFGQHPLDRRRFEACWNQIDKFHQQLDQGVS